MSSESNVKWHQRPFVVIILLLLVLPLGLYFMWKNGLWSKATRWVVTAICVVIAFVNVANNYGSSEEEPTVENTEEVEEVEVEESNSINPELDAIIKEGYFTACETYTVETLVNSFFTNPEWESFISPEDGKYHLNATGGILYEDKPAVAAIQFEIEGDSWEMNAFEIDGEPQTDLMSVALIKKMCSSVEE
jgi:hypothetical protein